MQKRPHTQFTWKTDKFTCIYATGTSCRTHASARNKATQVAGNLTCRMQANLPAFCMCFYQRCIAVLPEIVGIFAFNFSCFCLLIACILPSKAGTFACQSRANLHELRI